MEEKDMITVIEELGGIIAKYKSDIKLKDWEIERLKKKIESIERYADFYLETAIMESDYNNAAKELTKNE